MRMWDDGVPEHRPCVDTKTPDKMETVHRETRNRFPAHAPAKWLPPISAMNSARPEAMAKRQNRAPVPDLETEAEPERPADGKALENLLAAFSFWYNAVRPHQHLRGLTPEEVWTGIDPYKTAPKAVTRFAGWDGVLRGGDLHR